MNLVLLLIFVLDLSLLALQVKYRSALGVVERGGAIERPENKCSEYNASHSLETQPPSNGTKRYNQLR